MSPFRQQETRRDADVFCRKYCTRKLGWTAERREECRAKTACDGYREHQNSVLNEQHNKETK
jgi:hypothetical protein